MEIMYTDHPSWKGIWVTVPKMLEVDALKLGNVMYRIEGIECTREFLQETWSMFK